MLTAEQTRRVNESIIKTQRFLDKELSYPEHLQKKDAVVFYKAHLIKLNKMLVN